MSLGTIPNELPFNLGAQESLPTILPYGLTKLLPTNTLPFTLSAREPAEEVPFGSIGWEIVCRAHDDFQTIIFRTADMAPPTFSKELSGVGLASVSFDLDNYMFAKLLTNGRPVEDLFDYENLWEIYFDKKLRFQFLGSAIRETPLDSSEVRTATVSGAGAGDVLSWASVYPDNFPNITKKVETLKDAFDGDVINGAIWNLTNTSSGGIQISRTGQKADVLAEIDVLTNQIEGLTSDHANAVADLAAETADYNAVFKDSGSTSAQKVAASKAYFAAKIALTKAIVALLRANIALDNAEAKSALAPNLVEDDNASRAKLTLTSSGQAKYLMSGYYDFVSSGVSARIEPLPQGATAGQAETTFGIRKENSTSHYAQIYTQSIGLQRRLVAEVNDNGEVAIDDIAYNPNTNAYWRIREDHAAIIFETSATGEDNAWVEFFRVDDVSWVSQPVLVIFKAELSGHVGIAPPLSAYISNINSTVLPAVESVMANFLNYLTAAQARGVISYVQPDFTDLVDTAGASWVGEPNVVVDEGTNLLQVIENFSQLQQFDWIMDNNFQLKVYQRVWNSDESDPTVQFHKEDSIVLHEGNAQLLRERTRDRSTVGNSIVGKNSAGQYAYMEDDESITKFQKRELFINAGSAPDLASLGVVLQSSLAEVADEKSSWRIQVNPDIEGRRVFDDYDVADWIAIEMIDSAGIITKNAWRVVGISIQVDSDGNTVAELTLQSRLQLLAERLKQQVANLGGSAASAGVTIGSSISAATLIEQAKLANLLDVVMPGLADRKEGDVVTWTGNYFTLTTPGDKTVPDMPVITGIESNVYYPESGTSTRAQVEVTWTTPQNTDGSTITDGHHYEVRYRPDTTLPYGATWEEAEQHLWNELYTWAQPTIPPIANTGWSVFFVGFDENSTVIQELSPGVRYEFQLRAVDSSTPQHFGEWSAISLYEAAEDSIPPAQPAPPVIASSLIAVQVTHYLGKAEGGEFNLPPDLSHLEVHVGGPSFFPEDATYVGKIIADVSILRGRTPVIQTFQVTSTEDIWVRVIAVDRTGNKSSPSTAVTTQVDLIDDAHISNLTASKITAGTISSAIILSGVIKTAEDGPRAEMNFEGFRIFTEEDDDASVSLLAAPGANGNYLMIKDPADLTATLAGIDGTGRGSFQSVSVAEDIVIQGESLLADIVNPRAKGVVAIGVYGGDPIAGGGVAVERGFLEISFIAEEARTYMVCGVTEFESSSTTTERLVMRLRDGGVNEPTLALPHIQQSISPLSGTSGVNSAAHIFYAGTFDPGLHRILWSFYGQIGNATVSASTISTPESATIFWVEDVGLPQTDTVILNDAGVLAAGAPVVPDKPAPPKAKVTYTKNYACTWSGTYRSNGDYSSSHGSGMVQGDSGFDNWLNDARALMGFNYSQIMTDLRGATIKAVYITLYANHWYWNDGGTARIGTHNYTGRPGGISSSRYNDQRVSSSNWPKPGKRKVSLGTGIGNEFKSGATKGIMLGPTDDSQRQYGKFNGNGQSNEPVLTIVYVK